MVREFVQLDWRCVEISNRQDTSIAPTPSSELLDTIQVAVEGLLRNRPQICSISGAARCASAEEESESCMSMPNVVFKVGNGINKERLPGGGE